MTRHGAGFLRVIVSIALCGLIVAVSIACFANWRRDGSFSLRVFDATWWAAGKEEAQPVISTAKEAADDFYDKLWGEGGWAEQAERWLNEQRAKHGSAEPDTAEGPKDAPEKSAQTQQLEAGLQQARDVFEKGMVAYNRGNPANGGWSEDKKRNIQSARESFTQTREQLDAALPAYKNRRDGDKAIAADADQLRDMNLKLLRNCNKMLNAN